MPINITCENAGEDEKIAWLCDDEWELPAQIEKLKEWLMENESTLEVGSYAADIGYCPRAGAAGGGAVVSITFMQHMISKGMELYLSEYPPEPSSSYCQI